MTDTAQGSQGQSADPWLCENPQHAHTDARRGDGCRPDSLRHPEEADEPAPVYWWCNSCGEEVHDETAECCEDGEIEPSYDD